MLYLYEMTEDGETCGDFPAINYRLSTFGEATQRPLLLEPQDLPGGHRSPGATESQFVTVENYQAQRITYSVCIDGRHIHIAERLIDGRREPTLLGISMCETDHVEHIARVAVRLEDLPRETQAILKKARPSLLWRLLKSLFLATLTP